MGESIMKFLFGGGWWTAWYIVLWLGGLAFVGLPLFAIIRDSVPKPAGPASLASVVLTMGVALYLGVVTFINAAVALRMCGQGWLVVLLVAVIATAAVMVGSYAILVPVSIKGGYSRSALAALVCVACFVGNLVMLTYARSATESPGEASTAAISDTRPG